MWKKRRDNKHRGELLPSHQLVVLVVITTATTTGTGHGTERHAIVYGGGIVGSGSGVVVDDSAHGPL